MAPDTDDEAAFGSGSVARDLGIPQPEATAFKWHLARTLNSWMQEQGLDVGAVAARAGETDVETIERITRGRVRDIDSYEIMRILSGLGYRFWIDMMPPSEKYPGQISYD